MADHSHKNLLLSEIKLCLVSNIGGEEKVEEFDINEAFMADLIIALRNGKSPRDALAYLANIGSANLASPAHFISRYNNLGY